MQTIFAQMSNHRNSAVCAVRISGKNALDVSRYIPSLNKAKHKLMQHVKIFDDKDLELDDVMAVYFKSPKSFTGEDVIEVYLHASPFIVSKFMHLLAELAGFRHAKAGEFCLRAVHNRKITLNEAEAINKLILSESEIQHRLAMREINGSVLSYFEQIKGKILQALALLETFIDFSEEEEISLDFLAQITDINNSLITLLNSTLKASSKQNEYDIQIAILGKPNVGKSTLFNLLTSTDDAIVSDIAGTTRDALKKIINIAGFKVELIDTAGLRDAENKIEKIGIERAKKIAINADVILILKEDDTEEIVDLSGFKGHIITVYTKADIHGNRSNAKENTVDVTHENASLLEKMLEKLLKEKFDQMQAVGFSCNERQRVVLTETLHTLQSIDFTKDAEIIAEELRHALHTIAFLVGGIDAEEILAQIFSNFCIGK